MVGRAQCRTHSLGCRRDAGCGDLYHPHPPTPTPPPPQQRAQAVMWSVNSTNSSFGTSCFFRAMSGDTKPVIRTYTTMTYRFVLPLGLLKQILVGRHGEFLEILGIPGKSDHEDLPVGPLWTNVSCLSGPLPGRGAPRQLPECLPRWKFELKILCYQWTLRLIKGGKGCYFKVTVESVLRRVPPAVNAVELCWGHQGC